MVTIATDALVRLARRRRRAHFAELAHRQVSAEVTSWRDFYAAIGDRPLLARLDEYPDSLLIAGCDWSAATSITHLFKRLHGDADQSADDELEGALLLAGLRSHRPFSGRPCFQTTYLGGRYREYLTHDRFKLVWLIREPHAAVHSSLSRAGRQRARRRDVEAGASAARPGASRLEKACSAYTENLRQMLELKDQLGERMAIVDYDELSAHRTRLLPELCRFSAVACNASLLRHLHGKSIRKGTLASFEAAIVDQLAMPAYRRARRAGTLSDAHG